VVSTQSTTRYKLSVFFFFFFFCVKNLFNCVACVNLRSEVPDEPNKTMRYSREPGSEVVLIHDKQTLGGGNVSREDPNSESEGSYNLRPGGAN
jgi:hypothetical protein